MQPMKLPEGTAVHVVWVDSWTRKGWHKQTAFIDVGRVESIGYVHKATDSCLALCSAAMADMGLDPYSIPWGAIERIEELGEQYNRDTTEQLVA